MSEPDRPQPETGDADTRASTALAAKWAENIRLYEREYEAWEKKASNVVKRYADERNTKSTSKRRYNVLWSNIQTLQPALYFSPPKPNVERRFKDKDPVGLQASEILEKAATYFVNETDFHDNAKNAVLDRLLGGRGVLWVRYVPHFKDAAITDQAGDGPQISDEAQDETAEKATAPQTLEYEEVVADYVHYRDFGHVLARTWAEVPAAWRKVYLDEDELKKRFPSFAAQIPLDHTPHEDEKDSKAEQAGKKATIYEIWDKSKKQVVWVHKSIPEVLDQLDDFLKIKDFFPFPRPLFATLTTDSLVPTPDYLEYRDQAAELDELTARIALITKSLKVVGVYDGSAEGLQNFLAEGLENKMIPIKSWAMFSEKGGLKNAVEFFPLEMIIQTVTALYEARDKVKADLDQITGIADIIRGQSDPNETAAAQDQKGKFATMRLSDMQNNVSVFIKETVQIMTEIIAGHFSQETLKDITGQQLMTKQEKMLWQITNQPHFAMGSQSPTPQPGASPPVPPQASPMPPMAGNGMASQATPPTPSPQAPPQGAGAPQPSPSTTPPGLNLPAWEDVVALMRNKAALCFKIDIETDSTIKQDQDADRAGAIEFAKMFGEAVQAMAQIENPALLPLMGEVLIFVVRKFKNARSLEQSIEETLKKFENMPPPPPKPDPAQIQAQSKMQIAQMQISADADREKVKYQNDQQMALGDAHAEFANQQTKQQGENQRASAKLSADQQMTAYKEQQENSRATLDAKLDIILARLGHTHDVALEKMKPPPIVKSPLNGSSAR